MDILTNIDDVAEAYPAMDGKDCLTSQYRCHFWYMTKLFFRVILTTICFVIATWFVLMFVIDIVLPFLRGTDLRSPGATPEVKSFCFSYLPTSGIKQAATFAAPSSSNGWVFVRNAVIAHVVLMLCSVFFMDPDHMKDKDDVRARIKTFLIISAIVTAMLILQEAAP
jgi:hypothetical protein